ncbi:UDP-2,4-diacetamido-2,4,6-trideoxy-beta-L-altropyranose hydrolase [Glaciimonas sp. GNP009]
MNIAIRVDASSQIGTGHFMRCLTLADALKQRGAKIRFVSRHMPAHLRDMLAVKGHEFAPLTSNPGEETADGLSHAHWLGTSQAQDATASIHALSDQTWDWLLVDHYALDTCWETALRTTARRIMVIDDIADRQHDCDVLLDQNFYADMDIRYLGKVPPDCQLLLGPRYVLLRDEFRQLREQVKPRTGPVKRVLVFFGGVDAENYTALAIEALASIARYNLQVDVVIGAQHPARTEIKAACARHGYFCHVQIPNMAELMAQADLAIGAGGTATWERCCLGLPTLTLSVARNQRKLVDDSALFGLVYAPVMGSNVNSGLLLHLQALLENPGLRALISRHGIDAVDGRGTLRVLRTMGNNSVKVRLANDRDSADLMSWRNHPSIRAVSRNSAPISAENHGHWLHGVLRDENRALLIGYRDEQQPIGVARFDMAGDCAEVSIYLVPGFSEQGLGAELLESAEQWLCSTRTDIKYLRAEVLGNNAPSHRLFTAVGYVKDSTRYLKKVH